MLSEKKINKIFGKALAEVNKKFKEEINDLENSIINKINQNKNEKALDILLKINDPRKMNILIKKLSRKKNSFIYLELFKIYLEKMYNIEEYIYLNDIDFSFIDYILDEFGMNIILLKEKNEVLNNKYEYLLKNKNEKITINNYLNYLLSNKFIEELKQYNKFNHIIKKIMKKDNRSFYFNKFLEENKDKDIKAAIINELNLFNIQELLIYKDNIINSHIDIDIVLDIIEEKRKKEEDIKDRKEKLENKINELMIIRI